MRPRGLPRAPRAKLPVSLRLGRSRLHGVGVFARDFLPAGERLLEYVGERISKAEAARREKRRQARAATGAADVCVYIFELNHAFDLDGDVPGNPARRINHSCAPNCEAQSDGRRIWIVARRDIAPGEELTYDYGFALADARRHPCRCGAAECAGFIVARAQRWRLRAEAKKCR
ncbi:MAG: SET domain-containing protein-lysine N-methyltransferase [Candidatus Didemnitutus sp.]|nr:SET domain-containing protein-lysine N-methyltransferase [Candidatus Didemnitutus sp.]